MQFQPNSQGQSAIVDWQEWFYSRASVVSNTLHIILLLFLHHCDTADFREAILYLHSFKCPESRTTGMLNKKKS